MKRILFRFLSRIGKSSRRQILRMSSGSVLFLFVICPFLAAAINSSAPAPSAELNPEKSSAELPQAVDRTMELDRIETFTPQKNPFEIPDETGLSSKIDLGLEDAIRLALKNHLMMKLAREKIGENQGLTWQAFSALLPHVYASLSQQRTWKMNLVAMGFKQGGLVGPFNTFDARFSLVQKLLDLSALARFQAGRTGVQIARYQENLADQKVTLIASTTYLEALRSYSEFKTSQADLELAKRLLEQARRQHKVGIATGVDVARAETQVAEKILRLEKSRADVHDAYIQLQRVTGASFLSPVRLLNSLCFVHEPLLAAEEAVATASRDRIEMQIARDQIRASRFRLYEAKAELLPKIEFTGDYGLSGTTPNDHDRNVGDILFRVSMPVFEGGQIYGQIKEADSKKRQEEVSYSDLRRQVEEDVRLALWTLETGVEQVRAASKVVALAQREFELANHRFAQGLGDNVEVVGAQTTLAKARDTYILALTQYHAARINMSFALGKTESFYLQNAAEEKES